MGEHVLQGIPKAARGTLKDMNSRIPIHVHIVDLHIIIKEEEELGMLSKL